MSGRAELNKFKGETKMAKVRSTKEQNEFRTNLENAATQPTEVVAELTPGAVPFKNTTVGKTVRTFLQTAAGVLLLLAASEEFRNFVTDNYPQLAMWLPLAASLFTAIQNGLDPNVKNI